MEQLFDDVNSHLGDLGLGICSKSLLLSKECLESELVVSLVNQVLSPSPPLIDPHTIEGPCINPPHSPWIYPLSADNQVRVSDK